ncbi:MAG: GNAT family N-acetyltransferase [Candidatus Hodarchaeales archaeon]|jgi:tRNA(Met) cytidine acetyltransferase
MRDLSQNRILIENNSRILVLFDSLEKVINSLKTFFDNLADSNQFSIKGAIIGEESLFQDKKFNKILEKGKVFPNLKKYYQREATQLLGSTHDFVVIDLTQNFDPNKLIIEIETVIGGGLILLIGEKYEFWIETVNKHRFSHSKGSILLARFLRKIKNNSNCIYALNEEIDLYSLYNPISLSKNLSEEFLEIPVSVSQYKLLQSLSNIIGEKNNSSEVNIIVADRGRGKSAAIGLVIAHILVNVSGSKCRVTITAQTISQTQNVFAFVSLGLDKMNIKYQMQRSDGQVTGINISKRRKIEYRNPEEISKDIRTEILIVEEAAAFPQDKLSEVLFSKTKKILVSTIHGYEGSGRSFQYKILETIKRLPRLTHQLHTLKDPIRYAARDLIETLLIETFFLQVEPPAIRFRNLDNFNKDIRLVSLETHTEKLFEENFPLLKDIMGLLIFSHYRNQPNDLLLIADSCRHFLAYLTSSLGDKTDSILLACQLAKEGALNENVIKQISDGSFVEGDLIPAIAIRYFSPNFAKLKGLRIVRIASHPDFRNKGLGRIAVEGIIKKFDSFDWIGASCGATVKLVKFWKKFGFKSIHIRPIKTPETSEWNIVLVNPLSDQAKAFVEQASRDFFFQFIHLLKQSLFELKPELALVILQSCVSIPDYKIRITRSGNYRLRKYNDGKLNFLLAVDVLQEIAIAYFIKPLGVTLSSSQELLLISRILQGRTWGQTLGKTGLSWNEANGLLMKAIKRISIATSKAQ